MGMASFCQILTPLRMAQAALAGGDAWNLVKRLLPKVGWVLGCLYLAWPMAKL